MADNGDMSLGYMMGQSEGGGNGWGGFGEGIWAVIILAILFGRGGFGWGGQGCDGGGGGGALTRAELYDGFSVNNIDAAVRGVQQGICDATYALNNTITNGFNGVDKSVCQLGYQTQAGFSGLAAQLADCCCQTQRSIDGVKYDMATGLCSIGNAINSQTRDIIDNQNANTRQIMDFMVNSKIESLQAENQSLKLAASQANQNSYLAALADAQTAELIRRIAPQPVPSYQVPAPDPYCGNNYGGCGSCC